ncbi:WapI family immunity protein [Ligilactobacillus saerimneri]|uniref:WapI family immunity protein n=1 Tax=Ligilactobacillus saerimneri TaxID=228229 RepID=UPI0004813FBA|nr:hypothetical protein [Ligilactobacillus saerimneri]KRL72636.1 hypothetical protein FC54_GL001007 [Ligilactobacillus saerimneri DSM 16049]
MILQNEDQYIEFTIKDYEFPDIISAHDEFNYDANWLICEVKYRDKKDTVTYQDPCLLTYELVEVSDALAQIIIGYRDEYTSNFTEPYLQFQIVRTSGKIGMALTFTYDNADWKDVTLTTILSNEEAVAKLKALQHLVRRFPKR